MFWRSKKILSLEKENQSLKSKLLEKPYFSRSGFFSTEQERFLSGWATFDQSIDYHLRQDLEKTITRSRELVRQSPWGKRFISLMRSNIVGPSGITIQAQSKIFKNGKQELDKKANDAIEEALKDWSRKENCDFKGKMSFLEMQKAAINHAGQDGAFLFRKHYGLGKYGFKLELLDSLTIDTQKQERTRSGGEIRLGVEYSKAGKIVRYWFREKDESGNYRTGDSFSVDAKFIIYGFLCEFPDQSRGIPWMAAGLEKAKHIDKYNESALVRSRATAATFGLVSSEAGDEYEGDENYNDDGDTLDTFEAGVIKNIGRRTFNMADAAYPHQMYEPFIKANIRDLSAAFGVSYQALSNDLSDTSFSSGRTGVMEDRELYKDRQEWFIDSFVRHVYEEWISLAYLTDSIKIGNRPLSKPVEEYFPAKFQARRWAWVDPAKDAQQNQFLLDNKLKSRTSLMSESGIDPEKEWDLIEREDQQLKDRGIDVSKNQLDFSESDNANKDTE